MTKATDAMSAANRKHGHACVGKISKEYRAWYSMIARCYNERNKEYDRYGGRGIRVCDAWRESFSQFLDDVGMAPTPAHTLDRKDTNLDYSPSNCRWATRLEQVRNRRNTAVYEGKTLAEWAEIHGLNYFTLMDRWRRGDRGDRLFRSVVLR